METRSPDISQADRTRLPSRLSIVLVVLLTLFFGLGCEESQPPPPDILGQWKTPSPEYAGRYFEVRSDTLTIDVGTDRGVTVYAIQNVRVQEGTAGRAYTIEYTDTDGEPGEMTLFDAGGGKVRVGHGDELWSRDSAASSAAAQPGRA